MSRFIALFFGLLVALTPANAQFFNPAMYFPTAAGGPAIGTPQSLGTHVVTSGTTSVVTTLVNVVSGDLLVAQICISSSTVLSVSSLSDGTNTYAKATGNTSGANYDCELWYKGNASAVSSGASLTATISGSLAGGAPALSLQALRVSGIIAAPLDAVNSQVATTSTPTVATGVLAKANEIVVGGAFNDASTAETPPAGFTALSTTSQSGYGTSQDYKVVNSTGSVTYNPTWGGSGHCITLVATFKGN